MQNEAIFGVNRRGFLAALAATAASVGDSAARESASQSSPTVTWTATAPENRVQSSPTVRSDAVYVGSDDGNVYAFERASGALQWHNEAPEDIVFSSPAVDDGTVYVGSHDATVYAVDAADGSTVWEFTEPSGEIRSSPTVSDGVVYVGCQDATVYAIDAESGDLAWESDGPGDWVTASPLVHDGTVYVADHDWQVVALDAETGDTVWTHEMEGKTSSSPTVADGVLYVGSAKDHVSPDDGFVYALDLETGERIWRNDEVDEYVWSSPTVHEGVVYVSADGLHAIDAETGETLWRAGNGEVWSHSSPTVAAETIYVGSRDGSVYAIDAETGEEIWEFETGDRVRSSPTVVNGTVYVGSSDGNVYALETEHDASSAGSRARHGTLGSYHRSSDVSIENLRLVQTVENTRVIDPENPRRSRAVSEDLLEWVSDDERDTPVPDPDLVLDRMTAPVFDLQVDDPDAITDPIDVTVRYTPVNEEFDERTVEIAPEAVRGEASGRRSRLLRTYLEHDSLPDQLPLLETLVPDHREPENQVPPHLDPDLPLFPATEGATFEVSVGGDAFDEPVVESVQIEATQHTRSLTVGVTELAITDTDTRTRPEGDIEAFAEDIGWELLHQFPVSEVTVAIAPEPAELNFHHLAPDYRAADVAEEHMNAHLDEAIVERYASGTQIIGGEDGVTSVDFTFGVVPRDFDQLMGAMRRISNQEPPIDGGMPYLPAGDRPWANAAWVKMGMEVTALHEYGHYLLGEDPYPEFTLPADEGGHTRSNVLSTAYKIQDRTFRLGDGRRALMASNEEWIDAETYQRLMTMDVEPAQLPMGQAAVDTLGGIVETLRNDPYIQMAVPDGSGEIVEWVKERTTEDVWEVMEWQEETEQAFSASINGVDYPSQAPDLPVDADLGSLGGMMDRRREIGETLLGSDETFTVPGSEDHEITGHTLGQRILGSTDRQERVLGEAQDWAEDSDAVNWCARVTANTSNGELEISTESVATLDDSVQNGLDADGDGEVTIRDSDDAAVGVYDAARERVLGANGSVTDVEGSYMSVVPLPEDAAELEVTVQDENGQEVSNSVDPTVDPIRTRVERMPDEAFEDPEVRQRVLDMLDDASTQVDTGDQDAVETTLADVYRELDSAIDGDYEGTAVDPDAVLARVEGQIQRRGGEAPDTSDEDDGLHTSWLAVGGAAGGAIVGGAALKRYWDGENEELEGS